MELYARRVTFTHDFLGLNAKKVLELYNGKIHLCSFLMRPSLSNSEHIKCPYRVIYFSLILCSVRTANGQRCRRGEYYPPRQLRGGGRGGGRVIKLLLPVARCRRIDLEFLCRRLYISVKFVFFSPKFVVIYYFCSICYVFIKVLYFIL